MLPTLALCSRKHREPAQIIINTICKLTNKDLKSLAHSCFIPILETWILTRHLRKNEQFDLDIYFIKKFNMQLVTFFLKFIDFVFRRKCINNIILKL